MQLNQNQTNALRRRLEKIEKLLDETWAQKAGITAFLDALENQPKPNITLEDEE